MPCCFLTRTPNFFFHTSSWFAPSRLLLALQKLWCAWPRAASYFFLSLLKGLASSPEIRSVWSTRRETCASTSPLASGPTATATTVTRNKDRRPCSTCDRDPPLSLDLNHQRLQQNLAALGVTPSNLIPPTNCLLWGSTSKNWCQTLKKRLFIPGLSPFLIDDSDPLGYIFNKTTSGSWLLH